MSDSELTPHAKTWAALRQPSHAVLTPRLSSKLQRAIDREGAWGLVQAARAQAAAFTAEARIEAAELTTGRAMLGLDRLQRMEQAMTKNDPIQAERYGSLIDDFMTVARYEIRRLPEEF